MKKILFLSIGILNTLACQATPTTPNSGLTVRLNDNQHQTRGLVGDLQSTLKETQTALANLPKTLSDLLPSVTNIQKLLLSASIIALGYRCCKYGLSHANSAWNLYTNKDTKSGMEKLNRSRSFWHTVAAVSFFIGGSCAFLGAKKLPDMLYAF